VSNKFLKIEKRDAVVILTMDQPEVRNVLTGNTAIKEIVSACAEISKDQSVRAVVLTGNGTVFSAGGNLRDMQRYIGDELSGAQIRQEYREGIQQIPLALYNLDVPTIAAVNGPAIGAGCDLACMCDIRIASDRASFAESFVKVGIVPGDGGAWFLPRVVGASRAAEMTFTGDRVNAEEALSYGLISRVVPHESLLEEALELADRIASNPGTSLRMAKHLMREGAHQRLDSLLELSAAYQALAHKTTDHEEAVRAFVEKRAPEFNK